VLALGAARAMLLDRAAGGACDLRYNCATMRRPEPIRSRENAEFKRLKSALAGREDGLLALEGERLVRDALRARFELDTVYVAERRADLALEFERAGARVRCVADDVLESASALKSSQGVVALAPTPERRSLATTHLGPDALVLVVAGIADPGNLGALARSAEAAGAQALGVVDGGVSPWNPRVLRGAMGSLLRLPVLRWADASAAADELAEHGFRQARAATRGGRSPAQFDWEGRLALWLGAETGELPPECDGFERITIPMHAGVESLNVTVAGSLLLFAAGRVEGA
jgi:TrmH family RNA methyltransferase